MLTMSAQLTQLSLEYDCFVVGFFVWLSPILLTRYTSKDLYFSVWRKKTNADVSNNRHAEYLKSPLEVF